MDTWTTTPATAVIGVVIGKLLCELNPTVWNAAARVEDETPPDGAIDDYLEWMSGQDEVD